jgi:PqqD family protein of HPr-rel-A system
MAARKPKVRSDLTVVEMEGEAVIYDEQSGQIHYLNRTATIVFNLCDGTSTVQEFAADIADAFSLSREEVERQVRTLIRNFRKAGFLDEPAAGNSKASSNGSRPKATLKRSAKPKKSNKTARQGTKRA